MLKCKCNHLYSITVIMVQLCYVQLLGYDGSKYHFSRLKSNLAELNSFFVIIWPYFKNSCTIVLNALSDDTFTVSFQSNVSSFHCGTNRQKCNYVQVFSYSTLLICFNYAWHTHTQL